MSSTLWIAIGSLLVVSELMLGTFVILWFGVSAVIVGLISLISDHALSTSWELGMFGFLSLILCGVGKVIFPIATKKTSVGQSSGGDVIGEIGTVIEVGDIGHGKAIFVNSIMGSRSWSYVTENHLKGGDTVKVVGIEGNALRVVHV